MNPSLDPHQENRRLKAEVARLRAQLLKAYKDRAELHARFRELMRRMPT